MNNLNIDNELINLIANFKKVLDLHEGHLKNFCNYKVQLEGWLKGEFLCFLDDQTKAGNIAGFDREIKLATDQRKKFDFRIAFKLDGKTEYAWLEAKHWLIGCQKGVTYNANSYFTDPSSVGIADDVKKLLNVKEGGRYLVILATANPGKEQWQKGIEKFNQKFAPLAIKEVAQAAKYPDSYFFGLQSQVVAMDTIPW